MHGASAFGAGVRPAEYDSLFPTKSSRVGHAVVLRDELPGALPSESGPGCTHDAAGSPPGPGRRADRACLVAPSGARPAGAASSAALELSRERRRDEADQRFEWSTVSRLRSGAAGAATGVAQEILFPTPELPLGHDPNQTPDSEMQGRKESRCSGLVSVPAKSGPVLQPSTFRFGDVAAPPYGVTRAHALDPRTRWIQLWAARFAQRPWC